MTQPGRDPSLRSGYRPPEELRAAIERETAHIERRALERAATELSESDRAAGGSASILGNDGQRAAYLAVRLPGTYAACRRVFAEIRRLAPQTPVASVLDLGSGPGTAVWAAAEVFPEASQATLLETEAGWVELGRRLTAQSSLPLARNAQWNSADLRRSGEFAGHDLVVLSYVLGELKATESESLVRRAWSAAAQILAIVEPGTPRGFSAIHAARAALIAEGAQLLAPCPHRLACPMAAAGDWCHFSQRLERTALHRRLKDAALAYEDEKFSYLVASRHAQPPGLARIVRHPRKNPGHVQLTLCVSGEICQRTVARSQKERYKLARQAEWGNTWSEGVYCYRISANLFSCFRGNLGARRAKKLVH